MYLCIKYRDMKCPKCKSEKKVKNGIVNEIQRYKCLDCNFNYTVQQKSTGKSYDLKRLGLILYLEGMSYHAIADVLDISHVSVMKWVKRYVNIQELRTEKKVELIDEFKIYKNMNYMNVNDELGLILIRQESHTLISVLGLMNYKQKLKLEKDLKDKEKQHE